MRFVNCLRENSIIQHVVYCTRQRGSDTPHILDLVISSDNFVSDITHLSPLGNSDHCVLHFNCHLHIEQAKTNDIFICNTGDYPKLIVETNHEFGVLPHVSTNNIPMGELVIHKDK